MIKNIQNILPCSESVNCYSKEELNSYIYNYEYLKDTICIEYLNISDKCRFINDILKYNASIGSNEELSVYNSLSTEAKSVARNIADALKHINLAFIDIKSFFQEINKKNITFYNKTASLNETMSKELVSLAKEYNNTKSPKAVSIINTTDFCLPTLRDATVVLEAIPELEKYISDFISHIKYNTTVPNMKCLNVLGYNIFDYYIGSKNAITLRTSINKLSNPDSVWGWFKTNKNSTEAVNNILSCSQKLNSVIHNINLNTKNNINNVITSSINDIDKFIHNSSIGNAKTLEQLTNNRSIKLSYVMNINYITQLYVSKLSVLFVDALKNMNNINKNIKHK